MYAKNVSLLLTAAGLLAAFPKYDLADDKPSLTLQEVLSRHLQAIGGQKTLDLPKSERITGTIERGGLHGTYTTFYKGDKYWNEEKIGINDSFSGYDGANAWQRDSNGNVRLLSSGELQDLHNDLYFNQLSYLVPNRLPGKVSLRSETERRTGDYLLDITPEGGKASLLFIDPKTFLWVKEQHYDDDRLVTTTESDFKVINGTLTSTVTRITDGDHNADETIIQTDDQIDVEAPDTLFAMPAVARNYRWIHPDMKSATIPFDASDHGIKLFVGINGEPAYVVLDSGASGMAIAKSVSDYLKLSHQGTFRARGYGGSTNLYPVKLNTVEFVDGMIFDNMTATAIDLPDYFGLGDATPSVGFIGYELLSRFVAQIDFRAEHITLFDPDTWTPSAADGQALPMEVDDNVPNIRASLDGLPPARFLIDTGDAASTIHLYHPFVTEHRLDESYQNGVEEKGYGVGGEIRTRRVRAKSFSLAGVTLNNVPTDLALDDKGGSSKWLAGALGYDFLSHFVVTFDYPHRRVFFAANQTTQQPFDTRTFGIITMNMPDGLIKDKQRVVVVYVDPKSPAYKAGIVRGDTVTQVDGQPADVLGLGGVRRLLSPDGGKDVRELSIIGPEGGTGKVKVMMYDPMPGGKAAQ